MTRCEDFYVKVEKDGNFCGMSKQSYSQVKAYIKFIKEHSKILSLTAEAVKPLMREPDEEVREEAISTIAKSLNYHRPPGSKKEVKKPTAKDVKEVIEIEREMIERKRELEDPSKEVTLVSPIPSQIATEERDIEEKKEAEEEQTLIVADTRETTQTKSLFNKTNENIEWAHWSWNPVTGCKRDCPYCYAHDIGVRFNGTFEPQFHPNRMSAPQNTKLPQKMETVGDKNVFVCSMADLFGDWIESEIIQAIIKETAKAPQWNFLFLTKSPDRLSEFTFPSNAWVGATIDSQKRVTSTLNAFRLLKSKPTVLFISMEPFNEEITYNRHDLDIIDWLIIGGRSESSGMVAFQPKWNWVEAVLTQARKSRVQVYFKPNLMVRPREYPGMEVF